VTGQRNVQRNVQHVRSARSWTGQIACTDADFNVQGFVQHVRREPQKPGRARPEPKARPWLGVPTGSNVLTCSALYRARCTADVSWTRRLNPT